MTAARMATLRGPSRCCVGTLEACHWGGIHCGGGGAWNAQRRTLYRAEGRSRILHGPECSNLPGFLDLLLMEEILHHLKSPKS